MLPAANLSPKELVKDEKKNARLAIDREQALKVERQRSNRRRLYQTPLSNHSGDANRGPFGQRKFFNAYSSNANGM